MNSFPFASAASATFAMEAGPALSATTITVLAVQCLLVIGSSLLGGCIPTLLHLTHRRMQFLISLVGGLMLGVGILHQLPHGFATARDAGKGLDWCVGWLLTGILLTFFMLRWLHFHAHVDFSRDEPDAGTDRAHDHDSPQHCHHDHDHGSHTRLPIGRTSWIGILIGLSLHTLLDGFAMAAHVSADANHLGHHGSSTWLLGLGTFLGVVLHKPLDSLSITSLMAVRGWSRRAQWLVNAGYALMCPLGVLLFTWGSMRFEGQQAAFVSAALAAAAGVFTCIALSDLLPEIELHSHDRAGLSATLVIGVLLAWGIGFLEPAHVHDHGDQHSHDDLHSGGQLDTDRGKTVHQPADGHDHDHDHGDHE